MTRTAKDRGMGLTPVSVALVAGLALAASASAQGLPETFLLLDNRPAAVKPRVEPLSMTLRVPLDRRVPATMLGAVDTARLLAEDAAEAMQSEEKPLRYGVGRDVDVRLLRDGRWDDVLLPGGGRLWSADIVATGAVGVRLHLTGLALPPGARLVVYSVDDPTFVAGPYEGTGPLGTGEFWTPTRPGERIRLEAYIPQLHAGALPGGEIVRVDRIQHIYRDPLAGFGDGPGCHNDVTCFPAWANTAKACGGIGTIGANALFCSGQMLNTVANDQTPYYLTANHCVSTASGAQTAEIYWNFRTTSCNGAPPALTSCPQSPVCTLVSTNATSDYCLLMIEGAIPNGLAWAGWTPNAVNDGTPSTCIHFPQGTYERLSTGTKGSAPPCSAASHVQMTWNTAPGGVLAPTEPGSSGSGVFRDDTQQLFGQLHCGPSACGGTNQQDSYGAFVVSYPNISGFLSAGSDDALEPNDSCAAARAVASGTYPNLIVKSTSEDWYTVSVAPGGTASFQISLTNANGDIDLQLFDGCGGSLLASSTTTTNTDSVQWTNNTGATRSVYARVYLFSDTRNAYSMTVSNGAPPPTGACCMADGTCSTQTSSACTTAGGTYGGDGVACASANCPTVYTYVGGAVGLVDGSGTATCGAASTVTINVPDSFTLTSVVSGFAMTHSYQGDVKVSLKHVPTGTTVSLVDRPGSPQSTYGFQSDNYGNGGASPFVSADGAASTYDVPAVPDPGVNNPTGPYKPETVLSAFIGENAGGAWQLTVQDCAGGDTGTITAFRLTLGRPAPAVCYANCDASTTPPILNVADFTCFLQKYANNDPYANCDASTTPPTLNVADFTCFLQKYATGCP